MPGISGQWQGAVIEQGLESGCILHASYQRKASQINDGHGRGLQDIVEFPIGTLIGTSQPRYAPA